MAAACLAIIVSALAGIAIVVTRGAMAPGAIMVRDFLLVAALSGLALSAWLFGLVILVLEAVA